MSKRIAHLKVMQTLLSAASLLGITSQPARAQTTVSAPKSTESLEEIIVTATKREENIQSVPESIVAYTQAKMDSEGVKRAEDIVRLTPGVELTLPSGQFETGSALDVTIRGITDATGLAPSGTATTGIYLDDTPIQARSNQDTVFGHPSLRVFDFESVEVLRGPQGTLFGAGAEGGVVRFVTRQPSLTDESAYGRTEFSATKDGDPSYEAGAAFGGPIVENQLGFRVSAWYRTDGGYVDRFDSLTDATNPRSNWQDAKVARGSLAFAPKDDLKITVSLHYQDTYQNDSNQIYENVSNLESGQYVNASVLQQPTSDTFYVPVMNLVWSLGAVDLHSITSYFNRYARGTVDGSGYIGFTFTGSAYPILPGQADPWFFTTRQSNVSEELRVQSKDGAAALSWTTGLYYALNRQEDTSKLLTPNLGTLLAPYTVADVFGISLSGGQTAYSEDNVSHDRQLAAFAQAEYKALGRVTFTFGLRVSKTSFDFHDLQGGPLNYPGTGPDLHTVSGSQSETPVTPKFGVAFQVNQDNMIYASAGKGYRVGGASAPLPALAACQAAVNQLGFNPNQYESDSIWSYELGSKSRLFGGRAQADGSVYYINWSRIQQFLALPACNYFGVTTNLGSAVSKGFDVQLDARIGERLITGLGVAYNQATFSQQIGTQHSTLIDKGDTLGLTPWALTGNVDYNFSAFGRSAYAHVDDEFRSHNSGRTASLDNPEAVTYDPTLPLNPRTNLLNARIGMGFGDALDVSLFANNILNAHPLLNRYHVGVSSPIYFDFTDRPLTVGLTAIWSFRGR